MEVYTVGHSTRSLGEFTTLLCGAGVTRVVDVRAFPTSRRHPQFNKDALSITLPAAGLDYRHMPALGGRLPTAAAPGLPPERDERRVRESERS